MQTFLFIVLFAVCVFFGLCILSFIRSREQKAKFRQIAIAQEKRPKMSDLDFCEKLSISQEDSALVSAIRKKLAQRGSYNPELIYPDDELWETFDFQLGDFIDEFSHEFINCGYGKLPYEELKQVGELVKCLVTRSKQKTSTK
jgi:hypothetical protein